MAVRQALALIGLFLPSFALRVYPVLTLRFDGLYGQDPFAYYSYGQQVRDAIAHLQLPGHFYWPLGYPALVALGFTLGGEQPGAPQLVSLIAGALVSVFVFLLTLEIARNRIFAPSLNSERGVGGEVKPRLAAIIAWVITAACGQLIQSSMVIMADTAGLMCATLSAWALLRYARTRRPAWIALTAFALAWATMTRWQYGGLAVPWSLYVLLSRPIRWRHIALAVTVGIITLIPQIAHTMRYPDALIGHSWIQDWSLTDAFAHDFVIPDGTFHYDQTPAQFYAQPFTNPYYMSPTFVVFFAIGIVILITRRKLSKPILSPDSPSLLAERRTGGEVVLLLGWIAIQYGFLVGIPYENIRFALAFVPPISVLTGIGAAWLITTNGVLRFAVVTIIILGLTTTLKTSIPIINGFVAAKNADLSSAQWIAQHIPDPNAPVYCLDLLLTMEHYTTLHPVQIFEMTPEVMAAQLAQTKTAYAVFNLWTTEHQWVGESPWIIYHWLKDHPGLTEIGSFGNYTLYRIGP